MKSWQSFFADKSVDELIDILQNQSDSFNPEVIDFIKERLIKHYNYNAAALGDIIPANVHKEESISGDDQKKARPKARKEKQRIKKQKIINHYARARWCSRLLLIMMILSILFPPFQIIIGEYDRWGGKFEQVVSYKFILSGSKFRISYNPKRMDREEYIRYDLLFLEWFIIIMMLGYFKYAKRLKESEETQQACK